MGIELERPELGQQALADGFSNEIGFDGTVRFLKNICGMWLIEECLKKWTTKGPLMTMTGVKMARSYGPLSHRSGCSRIRSSDSMPGAIREYCQKTEQLVPEEKEALRMPLVVWH